MNIKFCSAQMMLGDVDQNWQKMLQGVAVVSAFQITTERVKKPQGCVRSVIHPFLRTVGKHVWNKTVADIGGERAQDVTGFEKAPGDKRQTFETDHRVTSPIGEPVIAGNDRADFVAGGMSARRLLKPARRRDDELVSRKNQFRWKTLAHLRDRVVEKAGAPLTLSRENVFGTQDADNVPHLS